MQLFALSLPVGKLVPGFLLPIFTHDDRFWIQFPSGAVKEPPQLRELCLGSEDAGPILHFLALQQSIPVKTVLLGSAPSSASKEYIDAFFDGQSIILGSRTEVSAYLRGALPNLRTTLKDRCFTFAELLSYVGEEELADKIRNAKAMILEVDTRFGILTADGKNLGTSPKREMKEARILDLSAYRNNLKRLPPFYSVRQSKSGQMS